MIFSVKGSASPFTRSCRGFFFFFGCQLHHLNPTSILHIANFITFCEGFLGTAPHFNLFCQYFCVRAQTSGGVVRDLGGMSIKLWPLTPFFPMDLPKSMGTWHRKWFYVSGLEDSLPAFFGAFPGRLNSWESSDDLPNDDKLLMAAAARLKERCLKGVHIAWTWVERRVLPLQARNELMCYYRGPADRSRVSPGELGEKEVRRRLALLTGLEVVKVSMEVAVEAFYHDAPPGEVNSFA